MAQLRQHQSKGLKKFLILVGFFVLIVFGSVAMYWKYMGGTSIALDKPQNVNQANNLKEEAVEDDEGRSSSESRIDLKNSVTVYVTGAVEKPGVVTLKGKNQRVNDAVKKVGGLTNKADLKRINLAQIIQDGSKIYIPSIGEKLEDLSSTGLAGASELKVDKKINLNTASLEELQTLPGVGKSMAQTIIEQRKKKVFKSVNDLMKISGFGQKKFDKIKNLIIV